MNKLFINTAVTLGFAVLSLAAAAGPAHGVADTPAAGQNTEPAKKGSPKKPGLNEGIVEEVDKESGNIVISHGRIKSKTVEMGPMTMSFVVPKVSLLDAVKAGDKVKINVENVNDLPTLTSIKVLK